MKLALVLIFALAAGLAVGIAVRPRPTANPPAAPASATTNVVTSNLEIATDRPITNAAASTNEIFHWHQIQSSDLRRYIANLRAVSCPEQTVRDVILAIVNRQFTPRFAAIKTPPQPYWQSRRIYTSVDQTRQLIVLEKERRTYLKELLGYEVTDPDHRGYKAKERDAFAFLSPERRALLDETFTRLREQQEEQMRLVRAELNAKGSTRLSEEQQAAKWRQFEREKREQLAKLLTKEELEEYELRTSSTAQSLRWSLSGFEPSPEEFRQIFRLQQKLDDQFGESRTLDDPPDYADRAKYDTAKLTMLAELKQQLGEQRYADYQRAHDQDYHGLINAVDQYGLAPDVPDKIWSLREAAQEQRNQILRQSGLTAEQQKSQLEQLANATRQQITGLMGERAFRRYEGWRPTSWWKELGNVVDSSR